MLLIHRIIQGCYGGDGIVLSEANERRGMTAKAEAAMRGVGGFEVAPGNPPGGMTALDTRL